MTKKEHEHTYLTEWNKENDMWIGRCTGYSDISYIHKDIIEALLGIIRLIEDIENEEKDS